MGNRLSLAFLGDDPFKFCRASLGIKSVSSLSVIKGAKISSTGILSELRSFSEGWNQGGIKEPGTYKETTNYPPFPKAIFPSPSSAPAPNHFGHEQAKEQAKEFFVTSLTSSVGKPSQVAPPPEAIEVKPVFNPGGAISS